jgi:multiple sugar transport system substrate-binding protein
MTRRLWGVSRRHFLAGVAATSAGALATRSARAQTSPTKITFGWPFANGARGMEDLAERFSEAKKTIQVEVQIIPQLQVIPKLTTAFGGGSAPDALAMSEAWLPQFAAPGWLENLSPYLSASGLEEDIVPAAKNFSRLYKNEPHIVGFIIEGYPLYYNKTMFADAGLTRAPGDVDEFREYAMKLTDAAQNRFGYYVLGGSGWQVQQWTTWMVNHGGLGVNQTFFDDDGRCILDGAQHVAGLQKWLDLYREDKVSPPASATGTFQDQANAFGAGQVAMVFGWGLYLTSLPAAIGEGNLGTAIPPAGPAGQFVYCSGNGFALNAASPNKEAAWEFIEFLMQPENNEAWNREYGAIPTNLKTWDAEWLKAPKYQAPLEMIRNIDLHMNFPRYLPGYASFQIQFTPEQTQKALLGRQTAAEHAEAVCGALNELQRNAI